MADRQVRRDSMGCIVSQSAPTATSSLRIRGITGFGGLTRRADMFSPLREPESVGSAEMAGRRETRSLEMFIVSRSIRRRKIFLSPISIIEGFGR